MNDKYSSLLFAFVSFGRKFGKITLQEERSILASSQYMIIYILGEKGPLVPKVISEMTFVDKTAVSRDSRELLKRGILKKSEVSETKIYKTPLELTEEGTKLYEEIKANLNEIGEKLFGYIDSSTLTKMLKTLRTADDKLMKLRNS